MKEIKIRQGREGGQLVSCESGDVFKLRLTPQTYVLRVRLMEGKDRPRSNVDYELRFGSNNFKGRTDQSGFLEVKVAPQSAHGELVFDDLVVPVTVGEILDVTTVEGIQARLNNLGYESGRVDGVPGRLTRAAIRAFQRDHPELKVDGVAGPKTQDALVRDHGC